MLSLDRLTSAVWLIDVKKDLNDSNTVLLDSVVSQYQGEFAWSSIYLYI